MTHVITFLSAPAVSLTKTIDERGVHSYPNVKRFTSRTAIIEELSDFLPILQEASRKGEAILTSPLKNPLTNESRKGQSLKNHPTRLLVLDFDDVPYEGDLPPLETIARDMLWQLPGRFTQTDYLVQASSSYGFKPGTVSFHVFFMLDNELTPRQIKDYLTHLNFVSGYFDNLIDLSDSAMSLKFGLDRVVNDSGRLIYIAEPVIRDRDNPITEREVFVPGASRTLSTAEIMADCPLPEAIRHETQMRLNKFRKERGLKAKKIKTRIMDIAGEQVEIVENPDLVRMTLAGDEGEYVRYNVNNGDSAAYWVYKYRPDIVYNFKGESAFLFSEVCEEAYEQHIDRFPPDQDEGNKDDIPVAFLDYSTARYHYGLINTAEDTVRSVYTCAQGDIKHFMAEYGRVAPKTLPVWRYEFRPDVNSVIDFSSRFINKYEQPKWTREPVTLPPRLSFEFGFSSASIRKLAPNSYKVIHSVCGSGDAEFEYFINWLAFIVQYRQKALTSWVFHGVPGTGKGIMHSYILAPLIGERYTKMKRMVDIEEQFNQWIEECLLLSVDEFRVHNSRQAGLMNKLKNMITESQGTIRAMRTDQIERRLYTNMMFFSNDIDAMEIQEGDRRFNIAPRQEVPLLARHPEMFAADDLKPLFEHEIPLLASYLVQFNVNMPAVRAPLENDAKRVMAEDSQTTVDLFVQALKAGDLDFFVPIITEPVTSRNAEALINAKSALTEIVKNYDPDKKQIVFSTDLRMLYNVVCGNSESEQKFGKMLARHGLRPRKIRRGAYVKQGVTIKWHLQENDIATLQENLNVTPTNGDVVEFTGDANEQ